MKKLRLVLADAAATDILEQADWYAAQSGQPLAERWENAVTSAALRIVRNPEAAALCSFKSPELRGVRHAAIPGFSKHLLFYKFDGREILILRVLHGARDLEGLF